MGDGARNLSTDPMVTVDVLALLADMSRECGTLAITNNAQLATAINGLTDAQTAALVRRLLAVSVRVNTTIP